MELQGFGSSRLSYAEMKTHRVVAATVVITSLIACQPSTPELDLNVRQSRGDLVVKNNESEMVSECLIQINDGWEVRNLNLPPGKAVRIPLERFTKRDGLRFNELTHEVQTILVQCFQPRMRAASFGSTR